MDDDSFYQISVSPHGNSFGNWQQFSLFNQISYSKRISTPSIHLNIPFSPSLLSQIGGMQPSLSDKDHPACRLSPGQPAVPPDCSHSAQPLWTHSWQATVLNDRLWCHSNLCNSVMSLYYTVGRGGQTAKWWIRLFLLLPLITVPFYQQQWNVCKLVFSPCLNPSVLSHSKGSELSCLGVSLEFQFSGANAADRK